MTLLLKKGLKLRPRLSFFFKYILEGYTAACRVRGADNGKDTSEKSGDRQYTKMLNETHVFKVMSILFGRFHHGQFNGFKILRCNETRKGI